MLFRSETMEALILGYTREAGVRNLEREVAGLCRKVAHQIVRKMGKSAQQAALKETKKSKKGKEPKASEFQSEKMNITPKMLEKYLGPAKYEISKTDEASEIGLANGLAWTETGGDLLQIEVAVLPGKGNLKITGKLGDVMQESAQAAMSYVRDRKSTRLNSSHSQQSRMPSSA